VYYTCTLHPRLTTGSAGVNLVKTTAFLIWHSASIFFFRSAFQRWLKLSSAYAESPLRVGCLEWPLRISPSHSLQLQSAAAIKALNPIKSRHAQVYTCSRFEYFTIIRTVCITCTFVTKDEIMLTWCMYMYIYIMITQCHIYIVYIDCIACCISVSWLIKLFCVLISRIRFLFTVSAFTECILLSLPFIPKHTHTLTYAAACILRPSALQPSLQIARPLPPRHRYLE
jgi:hypothetical protein